MRRPTSRRWSLTRRDRLQAADAAAVVLIVSATDGGAMQTLRYTAELGRPRFVLDAPASGNQAALADGAELLPWNLDAATARLVAKVP